MVKRWIGSIPVDYKEHKSFSRRNTLALAPRVDIDALGISDPEILGAPSRIDPRLRSIGAVDNRACARLAVGDWALV